MFGAAISGTDQLRAKFDRMTPRMHLELKRAMQRVTLRLKIRVQQKLSGQVLQRRTGRLYDSIHSTVMDDGQRVVGIVGSNVVYARIHEYGGQTRPHLITVRHAMALAFEGKNGEMVFRKSVNHPGSKIPMRSFLLIGS